MQDFRTSPHAARPTVGRTPARYDLAAGQVLLLRCEHRVLISSQSGHFLVHRDDLSDGEPLGPCALVSIAAMTRLRVQCIEEGTLTIMVIAGAERAASVGGASR